MPFIERDVYAYFKKEIEESANEEMAKIKASIEKTKKEQLALIEEDIQDAVNRVTETELNEINTEFSAAMNRIKTNTHQQIIKKKHKLLDSILEEVRIKLIDFTKSKEYKKSMKKAIKVIDESFCGDQFLFQIKKDDKILEEIIKDKYSKTCKIEKVNTIQIGGFVGVCTKKGILTDLTIDNQLEEAKNRFYEKSNLELKK